jgi:dihydroneopterin aldolase
MTRQGRIDVTQLEIETIIGAYPREREVLQTIYLDLALEYDFAPPASNDDLTLAIDYDALTRDLAKLIKAKRFKLLETLTLVAADYLLSYYPLTRVEVTVHKPSAMARAARISATLVKTASQ